MNKLHFKGDHRNFVPNRIVGPDMWGAWYLPLTAHYIDGVTTIFYKPVPPDQLPPQAALLSKQVVAKQHQGRTQQWPRGNESSLPTRLPSSLLASPTSRLSGSPQTGSGAKGLTKSQRALLKRFKKQGSR